VFSVQSEQHSQQITASDMAALCLYVGAACTDDRLYRQQAGNSTR